MVQTARRHGVQNGLSGCPAWLTIVAKSVLRLPAAESPTIMTSAEVTSLLNEPQRVVRARTRRGERDEARLLYFRLNTADVARRAVRGRARRRGGATRRERATENA